MTSAKYDLEERTYEFAREVRALLRKLPHSIANEEDGRQLLRASGSVGSNYIEANNALGRRDFKMKIRTSCKEAKESRYLLRLIDVGPETELQRHRNQLVRESTELAKIFGAIIQKSSKS